MVRGELNWGRETAVRMASNKVLCVRTAVCFSTGYEIFAVEDEGLRMVADAPTAAVLWSLLAELAPRCLVCDWDHEAQVWKIPAIA